MCHSGLRMDVRCFATQAVAFLRRQRPVLNGNAKAPLPFMIMAEHQSALDRGSTGHIASDGKLEMIEYLLRLWLDS